MLTKYGQNGFYTENQKFIVRRDWKDEAKMVLPEPYNSDRACEILNNTNFNTDFRAKMTDGEIAYTMQIWNRMPGYTCFYDAIVRIAKNIYGK